MAVSDEREELNDKRQQALHKGGPEHIAARRRRGTLTARERVLGLLDPGTFVEIDLFVDGVVAGHGLVDGREVYVFSQGWTQTPQPAGVSGAAGSRAAQKIVKIIDLAVMSGVPVVGLYDGGLGAPGGYASVALRVVMASGVVPQISAILGPCVGGAAHAAALSDLVFMVKGTGHLAVTGPQAAEAAGETATLEELGGAMPHSRKTGVVHLALDDEPHCLAAIRRALSYLPLNNLETAPFVNGGDPVGRTDEELAVLNRKAGGGAAGDVRAVVTSVVDGEVFLELMPSWAENLVIGFARLGGRSVGIVANQPQCGDGRLDGDAAVKGARFIRLCDAFNLSVVTFVDTPGYVPGVAEEMGGAVRHGAKLLSAYCEATVPKLTVIIGRAYDEAYEVMGSKAVRADFSFAWSGADLRVPGLPVGAGASDDDDTPLYVAAENGLLDDVIQPEETRPRLAAALAACISKREGCPPKKHGNIPL